MIPLLVAGTLLSFQSPSPLLSNVQPSRDFLSSRANVRSNFASFRMTSFGFQVEERTSIIARLVCEFIESITLSIDFKNRPYMNSARSTMQPGSTSNMLTKINEDSNLRVTSTGSSERTRLQSIKLLNIVTGRRRNLEKTAFHVPFFCGPYW